jgi:hypothetical protein
MFPTSRLPALLPMLLLAGCATVSSGISPDAVPDRYVMTERTSPLQGGGKESARTAIARAAAFCRARDRQFVPVDVASVGWPIQQAITGPTGVVLTFRCDAPREQQMNVGEP